VTKKYPQKWWTERLLPTAAKIYVFYEIINHNI